jgi:hypothetical protein
MDDIPPMSPPLRHVMKLRHVLHVLLLHVLLLLLHHHLLLLLVCVLLFLYLMMSMHAITTCVPSHSRQLPTKSGPHVRGSVEPQAGDARGWSRRGRGLQRLGLGRRWRGRLCSKTTKSGAHVRSSVEPQAGIASSGCPLQSFLLLPLVLPLTSSGCSLHELCCSLR